MMENLRAASNSIALKIILALIIISFVLTGVSGYIFGGADSYAAKVNGQEISFNQLEQAIQYDRDDLRRQWGDRYNELSADEAFNKQRRQFVLDKLIDDMLLAQYIEKLDLSVGKTQIVEAIRSNPYFEVDGKFNNERYKQVLQDNMLSSDQYAENVRRGLIKNQLISVFGRTEFTLPKELEFQAALDMQQREVRIATIDVHALAAKQLASDEEIDAYYEKNKIQFNTPEQFKVSYIEIDSTDLQKNIHVSDDDIAKYYEEHQVRFTQPARYDYSVIQVNTLEEAQQVLQELQAGADFALVAKQKSIDLSSQDGGQQELIEVSQIDGELAKAALAEKGQISAAIVSEDGQSGYYIFRLNNILPKQVSPLTSVTKEIRETLQVDKAKVDYYALQQKVGDAIQNDPYSLASAEKVSGLKVIETDWFTQTTIPGILQEPLISRLIVGGSLLGQNGAPAANSDILQLDSNRALVMRIAEHRPATIQPLDDVRDEITKLVKQQKALEASQVEADKLVDELKAGASEDIMKQANLAFAEAVTLNLSSLTANWQNLVFQQPYPQEGKSVYSSALDNIGNIIIIALDKVEQGTLAEEQKENYQQQMTMNGNYADLEALMKTLRQQAKIEISNR